MQSDIIQKAIERVRKKRGDDQSFKIKLLIASNIRRIMIAKNIKGVDLAEKLQCNESLISKWVSGQENFTIETLTKIAAALGVTYHDLTNPYISVNASVELTKQTVVVKIVQASFPAQKINDNQKKQTPIWNTVMPTNIASEMKKHSIEQHNSVSIN